MPEFAIIIPYYQTEPGILRRALASVAAQGVDAVAIVVDDGSPVPASTEIEGFENVYVVRQGNRGPGAARNAGISAVPSGTKYLAFLDSDDSWARGHLARGQVAFRCGAAIYVSNWTPLESAAGQDAYSFWGKLNLGDHTPVADEIYRYSADIIAQEIENPIFRLSTMIVDFEKFSHCRFPEDLRYASEDKIFGIELALADPVVIFSARAEVLSGRGANVFSGTLYGTTNAVRQVWDQIVAMKRIAGMVSETRHKHAARDKLFSYRTAYLRNCFSLMLYRPLAAVAALCRAFRDPALLVQMPRVVLRR
jgi:succinoglycan biosynthesis protein ExoW